MDELMDMITSDESPSQITDKIKDLLFAKSAERVDTFKSYAANSLFGEGGVEENEIVDEIGDYEEEDEE